MWYTPKRLPSQQNDDIECDVHEIVCARRCICVYSHVQWRRMHGKTSNGWTVCQQYAAQHETRNELLLDCVWSIGKVFSAFTAYYIRSIAVNMLNAKRFHTANRELDRVCGRRGNGYTVHKQSGESVLAMVYRAQYSTKTIVRSLRHNMMMKCVTHGNCVYLELG